MMQAVPPPLPHFPATRCSYGIITVCVPSIWVSSPMLRAHTPVCVSTFVTPNCRHLLPRLTEEHFNAVAENFIATLKELNVPQVGGSGCHSLEDHDVLGICLRGQYLLPRQGKLRSSATPHPCTPTVGGN